MKDSDQAASALKSEDLCDNSKTLEYGKIEYRLLPGVYPPSDDSFLLVDAAVAVVKAGHRVLEVCCGAGLVAIASRRAGGRVIASDINYMSCLNASLNGLQVVRSDLFDAFCNQYELLLCNPPYLPSEENERINRAPDPALDGGIDGFIEAYLKMRL